MEKSITYVGLLRSERQDWPRWREIQVMRRLLGDAREDRRGDHAPVVSAGLGMRVVHHDQADEFGLLRRQKAHKGNDILAVLVAAVRPHLLRRAGLAGHLESGHLREWRRAAFHRDF